MGEMKASISIKTTVFVLMVQKMKVKSGTYGAPDTNYYLEQDDFSHAKALGGNEKDGPRWFVVWKKSGELSIMVILEMTRLWGVLYQVLTVL